MKDYDHEFNIEQVDQNFNIDKKGLPKIDGWSEPRAAVFLTAQSQSQIQHAKGFSLNPIYISRQK